MAAAKNTRARNARSLPRRIKRRPVPAPTARFDPTSAVGILSAVRRRLKFVMAAAFTVSAALEFQNAEMDAEVALIVGRCVGDEIDRQIEEIDGVIAIMAGARASAARRRF